jgi:hypothetical protein
MNVKRILSRLRLDKIASVDRPCQEGATVALIKRAEDTNGEKMAKSIYDAFEKAVASLSTPPAIPDETAQAFERGPGRTGAPGQFLGRWYKGTRLSKSRCCPSSRTTMFPTNRLRSLSPQTIRRLHRANLAR